ALRTAHRHALGSAVRGTPAAARGAGARLLAGRRREPAADRHTAAEVTLFTEPMAVMRAMRRLPIVGVRLHDALVRRLTRAIFDDGADALARRWVAGGGTASRYRMTWSAAGNPIGSPHGLDVALLFAREDNWQHVVALQGSTWADVHAAGRALRTIWAAFARGDDAAVRTRGGVVQIESGWTERSATRF